MAQIQKIVSKAKVAVAPVKVATVQKVAPKVAPAKVATVAKKQNDFQVFDMSTIQLLPKGGGGGRGLSEFTSRCLDLEIGQGIKISEEKYNNGKGVASLYAAGKRRGIRFRVRKDTNGNLWLFRIEPKEEVEATEEGEE